MSNRKFALSIMAQRNQEQHFSTVGCNFMQLIMTSEPISLPANFRDNHNFYEFLVPLTEIPGFSIDGQEIACAPGTVIPINPGQSHGVRFGRQAVSFILIVFEQERMDSIIRQVNCNPFNCRFDNKPQPMASEVQLLVMRILQEKGSRRKGTEIILQCLAEEMAVMLVRHYYTLNESDDIGTPELLSGDQRRFQAAVAFIQSNFAGRITIDELADLTGMNNFHFIRCFKRVFNISPYNYLTRVRISRAKQLLLESELPAAVIGKACGFQSASRFSAVFLKDTGISPSQFRKENSITRKVGFVNS